MQDLILIGGPIVLLVMGLIIGFGQMSGRLR
jgi:hypothetical protein